MNLTERADYLIKTRGNWLREAKQTKRHVEALPDEIKELDADIDTNHMGELTMLFHTEPKGARNIFNNYGVHSWEKSFSSYDGEFSLKGRAEINGVKVIVHLHNVDKPANCKIKEYTERIKRYKSICKGVL